MWVFGGSVVAPHGGLRRTRAAVANDRAMPGRRPGRGGRATATAVRPGASLPLDAIRRPRDTPIWKLEAALKCRSCKKDRYAPPVHMIKLTATQEIHPDEER
jgi:hypothetical protein